MNLKIKGKQAGLIKGFVVAAVATVGVLLLNGMTSAPWAGLAVVESGIVGAVVNEFVLHS